MSNVSPTAAQLSEISANEIPRNTRGVVALAQEFLERTGDIVIVWTTDCESGDEAIMQQITRLQGEKNIPDLLPIASRIVHVDDVSSFLLVLVERLMKEHSATPKPDAPGWYVLPSEPNPCYWEEEILVEVGKAIRASHPEFSASKR